MCVYVMLASMLACRVCDHFTCVWLRFKLEGDERGWLEIDSATGELKTKAALDYETVQDLTVKVIVSEKGT